MSRRTRWCGIVAVGLTALALLPGAASAVSVTPATSAPTCSSDVPVLAIRTDAARSFVTPCSDGSAPMATYGLALVDPPAHGAVALSPLGRTYYPGAGYQGPDRFSYIAFNQFGRSALVVQDVSVSDDANLAPACYSDGPPLGMRVEDTVHAAVACQDPDGDPLTGRLVGTPALVALTAWRFSPASAWPGPDLSGLAPGDENVLFTASDGRAEADPATLAVHVSGPGENSAPVCAAAGDTFLYSGTTLGRQLACTDHDGDPIHLAIGTQPVHGTAEISKGHGYSAVLFHPAAGYGGPDDATVVASDGRADAPPVPVHFEPFAPPACGAPPVDPVAVRKDHARTITADCPATGGVAITAQPQHGTVGLTFGGRFSYTPAAGYEGDDAFSYAMAAGPTRTQHLTVSAAANVPPSCVGFAGAATQGGTIDTPLGCIDDDGDAQTATIATPPAHGTASIVAGPALHYVGDADYHGVDDLTVSVDDGHGGTASVPVTLVLRPAGSNNPPICPSFATSVAVGGSLSLSSAACRDDEGDPLTYTLVQAPAHGTVSNTDHPISDWSYHADPGYVGADTIKLRANDGKADSNLATISLYMGDGMFGYVPSCSPVGSTVAAGAARRLPLDCVDFPFVFVPQIADAPQHGHLDAIADGRVVYHADAGFTGTDTFTYRGVDANGHSTPPATVTLVVTPAPPPSPGPITSAHGQVVVGSSNVLHPPRPGWIVAPGLQLGTATAWIAPGVRAHGLRLPHDSRKVVVLIVSCPDGCSGRYTAMLEPLSGRARSAAARRGVRVGGGALRAARGGNVKLTLRVDRRARAALRRWHGKARLRIAVGVGRKRGTLVLKVSGGR